MDLSQVQGFYGLRALATPTNTLAANDVQIGTANTALNISDANVVYACRAIFVGGTSTFSFDVPTGTTVAATTYVAGTAQIETATAVGTITATTANIGVVITAAGMTGSPKTVTVAVVKDDTATDWAGKVRTALNADTDITALFSVGPATASTLIQLTRKPTDTMYAGTTPVYAYAANDATLNIALNAGASGATTAGTSADTTAGVVSSGVKVYDADGKDIEGNTIPTIDTLYGIHIQNEYGIVKMDETSYYSNRFVLGSFLELSASGLSMLDEIGLSATMPANVTVTVIGKTV